MKKGSILYFYVGDSPFVNKDIEILSGEYKTKTFNFQFSQKWKTPFQIIQQCIFLFYHIFSAKAIVCQLAGYHSFLPVVFGRIFGKPSLIIAAGTDCQSFPSIGYGNFQKKILKYFTKSSFQLCSHISPKHESLIHCVYNYDDSDFPEQGLKYFIQNFKKKFTVINNGYDPHLFKNISIKKTNHFVTVSGNLSAAYQQKLKGIDLIIKLAPKFPNCTFTIIGVTETSIFKNLSTNINLLPPVNNADLIHYYSEAQYYLQLSMAEGFPNALCEAMLCECIPVGSNVFSIPEIIGDTGYILNKRNDAELEMLISNVIQSKNYELGLKARERIKSNYTIDKRKKQLLDLLTQLISE